MIHNCACTAHSHTHGVPPRTRWLSFGSRRFCSRPTNHLLSVLQLAVRTQSFVATLSLCAHRTQNPCAPLAFWVFCVCVGLSSPCRVGLGSGVLHPVPMSYVCFGLYSINLNACFSYNIEHEGPRLLERERDPHPRPGRSPFIFYGRSYRAEYSVPVHWQLSSPIRCTNYISREMHTGGNWNDHRHRTTGVGWMERHVSSLMQVAWLAHQTPSRSGHPARSVPTTPHRESSPQLAASADHAGGEEMGEWDSGFGDTTSTTWASRSQKADPGICSPLPARDEFSNHGA